MPPEDPKYRAAWQRLGVSIPDIPDPSHADEGVVHNDGAGTPPVHGDIPHSDVWHGDHFGGLGTHSDDHHDNFGDHHNDHGDHDDHADHADSHHDAPHNDEHHDAHADDPHNDHGDTHHNDSGHSDAGHTDDGHSDGHGDHHGDNHSDLPHWDDPHHGDHSDTDFGYRGGLLDLDSIRQPPGPEGPDFRSLNDNTFRAQLITNRYLRDIRDALFDIRYELRRRK